MEVVPAPAPGAAAPGDAAPGPGPIGLAAADAAPRAARGATAAAVVENLQPRTPLEQLFRDHPVRAVYTLRVLMRVGTAFAIASSIPAAYVLAFADSAPFLCNTILRGWTLGYVALQGVQLLLRFKLHKGLGDAVALESQQEVASALLRLSRSSDWQQNQRLGLFLFVWFVVGGGCAVYFWQWRGVSTALMNVVVGLLVSGLARLAFTFLWFYVVFTRSAIGVSGGRAASAAVLARLKQNHGKVWGTDIGPRPGEAGAAAQAAQPGVSVAPDTTNAGAAATNTAANTGVRRRRGADTRDGAAAQTTVSAAGVGVGVGKSDDSDGNGDADAAPVVTSCVICFADYEPGQRVVAMPCHPSHVFHEECIVRWLQRDRSCPVCRDDSNLS